MRLRLLVFLAWLAWLVVPVAAFAKPTLAVAPIDGDKGGKIAKAVAEAAEDEANVIGPAKVEAMMEKLNIKEIDGRAVKKLRKKLDAEVIVFGSVDKGSKDKLQLKVSARGKKTQTIELSYKSFDAKTKKKLGQQIRKQIDDAELDESNNDDDDEPKEKEREKDKPKRIAKNGDDDGGRVRKRRRDDDEDDERPTKRVLATQAAIRIDAGAVMARRALTYSYAQTGLANYPPGVGTLGPAGRIEAEVYPGSFDTLKGVAANIGLVVRLEKTFAVGIDVPGTSVRSTVDQARYEVGARYRIPFGPSAVAFGVSYWHRHYKFSRDGLTMPTQLDAPDVSYNAASPHVMVRIGATKELAVFFNAAAQLMFSTGQIQEDTSFGPADVLAFEATGGLDYAVAKNMAVHVAAEFGQVGLKFKQKAGTMSASRGVGSATDRIIGASASLSIFY